MGTRFEPIGPDWRSRHFTQIAHLLDNQQRKRVLKLMTDPFFLMSVCHESNTSNLFSYEVSGSTQTRYNIQLRRDHTFSCNCPDAMFEARRHCVMCKHVVFTLVRVLKIFDLAFFRQNKVPAEFVEIVLARSSSLAQMRGRDVAGLRNASLSEQLAVVDASGIEQSMASLSIPDTIHGHTTRRHMDTISTPERRGEFSRAGSRISRGTRDDDMKFEIGPEDIIEDCDCPVCFDLISDGKKIARCPECKNIFHHECVRKWLNGKYRKTCVMCRSDVWQYFCNFYK